MTQDPAFFFQIQTSSGVPIYRQIMDQVKIHVAAGRFRPGEFIPSARQVAGAVEVNPMTVFKAYSLLEQEGVLEAVRGQGMRVRDTPEFNNEWEARQADLIPLIKEVIGKARQLSLDPDDVRAVFTRLWEESS